jgi:hypothetical protein
MVTALFGALGAGASVPGKGDRVKDLLSSPKAAVLGIAGLDKGGLDHGQATLSPWAADQLPLHLGAAASRRRDPRFPLSDDWATNHDYVQAEPAAKMLAEGKGSLLSPAEKYDYLVGDRDYTLTAAMWNKGRVSMDQQGKVDKWMTLGHGWAGAATRVREPRKSVTLLARDGKRVTFAPYEIKALVVALWADGLGEARFVGTRCNDRRPAVDTSGRLVKAECRDTNPATWHLALANELGVFGKSFVIDLDFGYKVENAPLLSYQLDYFTPGEPTRTFKKASEAMVPYEKLEPSDPFAAHRSPDARYLVGVHSTIQTTSFSGIPSAPGLRRTYTYDLELGAHGEVLGGEWPAMTEGHQHPDFLWSPSGTRMLSVVDAKLTGAWDAKEPVPAQWAELAPQASGESQPMAAVVEKLVELSH